MANFVKVAGLIPVMHNTGAPFNDQGQICEIPLGYATTLRIGDPVAINTTQNSTLGLMQVISTGETAGAGPTSKILGVCLGFGRGQTSLAQPDSQTLSYYPAGGDGNPSPWYVLVAQSPDTIFEITDLAGVISSTDIGKYLGYTRLTTANRFVSDVTINSTSPTSDVGHPLKLLRLKQDANNSWGTGAQLLVMVAQHALNGTF